MKVRGPAVALAATVPAALQLVGGCVPPAPPPPTPEASLGACEAGALAELRRIDPAVEAATLDPLADATVERRTPPPAQAGGGVGLVIAGRGTATGGGAGGRFRYTCLVGTAGPVLYVEVRPQGFGPVAAECADRPEGRAACLRGLAATAEAALARAEAAAVAEARRRAGRGAARAEVDEPAAASIGAWRVYRDAECARRHGAAADSAADADREAACLVELTRGRIAELEG